jgi:trans-aconitate 2-methyltransferase
MVKPWNPEKYLQYADLHSQAIWDLVHRVEIENPRTIVDLGCGPGNSTELAAARWPDAEITGVDISAEMLEKGKAKHPDWHWILAGIEDFHPNETFDVVMSCATLQWLHHHERLLPRLWELVQDRGALAAQMPANQESPLHRAVFQTAQSTTWRSFAGESRSVLNFQPPLEYFSILSPLAQRIDIWETIYYHEMRSLDDLLDWAKATVMRPFFENLPDEAMQNDFAADVRRTCANAYPTTNRGTILYVQKRLFFIAYKTA